MAVRPPSRRLDVRIDDQTVRQLMTTEDRSWVDALLRDIGGPDVVWGSIDVLNVWMTEKRVTMPRRGQRKLLCSDSGTYRHSSPSACGDWRGFHEGGALIN